jgi:hypothetical protein
VRLGPPKISDVILALGSVLGVDGVQQMNRVAPTKFWLFGIHLEERLVMKAMARRHRIPAGSLGVAAVVSALLAGFLAACGSSSPLAVATSPTPNSVTSPTPDAVTRDYVALVHNYWIGWQAADGVSNGTNQAGIVCLGLTRAGPTSDMHLIDPAKCRARMVVLLALHKKFLKDLDSTPPPPRFAADDQVFRSQLPKVIADTMRIIAAADTRSKQAVLKASVTYATDVHASLLAAMDDVEPSVAHV